MSKLIGHFKKTVKEKRLCCELYNTVLSMLMYYCPRNFENGKKNAKKEFLKIRNSCVLMNRMQS